jgi:hypothetical protein
MDKIVRIIAGCKFSVHDISRTELDPVNKLPRFNMPFELGLFLGCQRFGHGHHRQKICVIFDKKPYRYQKFLSDIGGQDIASHNNKPDTIIERIRDWIVTHNGGKILPGGTSIVSRYKRFRRISLPKICRSIGLGDVEQITFTDLVYAIKYDAEYLSRQPAP